MHVVMNIARTFSLGLANGQVHYASYLVMARSDLSQASEYGEKDAYEFQRTTLLTSLAELQRRSLDSLTFSLNPLSLSLLLLLADHKLHTLTLLLSLQSTCYLNLVPAIKSLYRNRQDLQACLRIA